MVLCHWTDSRETDESPILLSGKIELMASMHLIRQVSHQILDAVEACVGI